MTTFRFHGLRRLALATAVASWLVSFGPAQAAIVDATSTRSVTADAAVGGLSSTQTKVGPATGSFGDSASAVAAPSAVAASAAGSADQTSDLGSSQISGRGSAGIALTLPVTTGSLSASADGTSSFVVTFSVDVLSSYTLAGNVDTLAIVTGGASLPTLANMVLFESISGGTTIFETLTDDEVFSLSGVLQPGDYRLTASSHVEALQPAGSSARSVSGSSSFDFTFEVTPADTVPEPSVPALLAAAAVAAAFARRRTKARV